MFVIGNISLAKAIDIISAIKNISELEALTEIEEMISMYNIQDTLNDIENMEREYYLRQHPYEIYYSVSEKRFRTYLPPKDKGGKRKASA